jgi:predicted transcriptional regulator
MNNLINSIYLETALLEANEWNEEANKKTLDLLSEYFQVCTKKDLDLIKADLDLIFCPVITDIIYNYLIKQLNTIKETT